MPELAYTSNASSPVERIMPQDIDAEKAVLAAMLLGQDTEVVEEALMKLSAKEFYRPAHRKIFEAMEELYNKNAPIDQLSLADRLKTRGDLDAVGGKPYIVELGNNTYALANWAHHADIVKRAAMLRDLIGASVRITALGYDAPDDLDEVVETSEKLLFDVTNKRVATNFKSMESLVVETFNELQELANTKSRYNGVRTGFKDLDDLFGGLRGGDLVILAARPSVGKTALALNIASRAAQLGTSVAFFSLEMSATQLVQRVLSTETRINSKKMQTGQMSAQDWVTLVNASDTLSKLQLWVDDTPSASILEVRAKARRQLRGVEPQRVSSSSTTCSSCSRKTRAPSRARSKSPRFPVASRFSQRKWTCPSSRSRSSPVRSSHVRASAPFSPTCANPVPSSKTPISSCSSIARYQRKRPSRRIVRRSTRRMSSSPSIAMAPPAS